MKHLVSNAEEQRAALRRMWEITNVDLPRADEETANALRAEYEALDGSWIHEQEMEIATQTPAQAAAMTQAAQQEESNAKAVEQKADQALAELSAFLALQTPTNAQTLAAVRMLCRVVRVLIRLSLRKFDATD